MRVLFSASAYGNKMSSRTKGGHTHTTCTKADCWKQQNKCSSGIGTSHNYLAVDSSSKMFKSAHERVKCKMI